MRTSRLRWSSPSEFNDPFDTVFQFAEGIKLSDIQECLPELLMKMIDSKEPWPEELSFNAASLLDRVKQLSEFMPRQKLINSLKQTEESQLLKTLVELHALWWSLIPDFRILCLSKTNDIAPMWTHYADGFKGVVFEFACNTELDSPWLVAKEVDYVGGDPMLSTAEEWANLFMMKQKEVTRRLFDKATYTKAKDWSYEKEWRISSFKRNGETERYSHYKFHKDELKSVYLGPQITTVDRKIIIELRNTIYPNADIFEGSTARGNRITFQQVH